MSQAAAQASAFYEEVAHHLTVWGIRDAGGVPAPMTPSGRAMPFWSSRERAVRATETAAYRGFEVFELSWDVFADRWLTGIERDGLRVGVNWTGDRQTGYDLTPVEVRRNVEMAIARRAAP